MEAVIIGLSSGVVFLGLLLWILTWVKNKADKSDVNTCLAVLKEDINKSINAKSVDLTKMIDTKADKERVMADLERGERQFQSILTKFDAQNTMFLNIYKQLEGVKEQLMNLQKSMPKRKDDAG